MPTNPNARLTTTRRLPTTSNGTPPWSADARGRGAAGKLYVRQLGTPNINQPLPAPGPVRPLRPYQASPISISTTRRFSSSSNQQQGGVEKRYSNGPAGNGGVPVHARARNRDFSQSDQPQRFARNLNNIRRHVLVARYVYDLPFVKGRPLLGNASGIADKLVGGQQFSAAIQGMSGLPFSTTFSPAVQGSVEGRPNVGVGVPLYSSARSIFRRWTSPTPLRWDESPALVGPHGAVGGAATVLVESPPGPV